MAREVRGCGKASRDVFQQRGRLKYCSQSPDSLPPTAASHHTASTSTPPSYVGALPSAVSLLPTATNDNDAQVSSR